METNSGGGGGATPSDGVVCGSADGGRGIVAMGGIRPVAVALALMSAAHVPAVLAKDALYREGMPTVLEKARPAAVTDDGRAVVEAFSKAYESRGRPRVMLFWNRELTDRLQDERHVEVVTKLDHAGERTRRAQGGGETSAARSSTVATARTNESTVDAGARAGPSEAQDWALEDAVLRALTTHGVNVVDRRAAMRFTAPAGDDREVPIDRVQAETRALTDRSDVLLEILSTPDRAASGGATYRIVVKAVGSGRILASSVTDAKPAVAPSDGPTVLVGPNGLERAAPVVPAATTRQSADTLAKQVLVALASAFRD